MNSEDIINHYQNNGVAETTSIENTRIATQRFEPDTDPRATIICLSGGPGLPGDILAPLTTLTKHGYRVMCYDQHNTGDSEDHPQPYKLDTFKDEVAAFVREYDTPLLAGHSWGSMLALDYALDSTYPHPDALLCIAPLFDTKMNIAIAKTRRANTADESTLRHLIELEADQDYGSEYEALEETVYSTHIFNTEKPTFVQAQYERFNNEMYEAMWGPAEYQLSNNAVLEGWSVLDDLHNIKQPTLLVTGEDDLFGTHDLVEAEHAIPIADTEIIRNASHSPFWEAPHEFHETVRSWLQYTELNNTNDNHG